LFKQGNILKFILYLHFNTSCMRRIFTFLFVFLSVFAGLHAQVVITSNDMPTPGDTVRRSTTFILEGIDYEQAGPDQSWNFSSLALTSQQVDTFISVGETPLLFQGFFNNQFIFPDYKATVAYKLASFTSLPGFTITDSYEFFKNNSDSYKDVGYGITYSGLTIPIQYDRIDTVYRFPLAYGNVDSAQSFFELELPDIGYASIERKRWNYADGWGTVLTPFGQFQALRVKTVIQEYDSVYIDSLNMGIPLERNIIEYKWLANGFPLPVLQVTVEGFIVTASYIDSLKTSYSGIYDFQGSNVHFSVYPNPSDDFISINYELLEDSEVGISLYSVYGNQLRCFAQSGQQRGLYNRVLYLKEYGFKPGIYLLRLTVDNVPYIKRILLN
jgi:hypothetical protein